MALALTQPDDLLVLPRLEGRVPVNDERDRTLLRSGAAPALAEVVFAMQEPDFGQRLPRVLTRTEGSLSFCPSLLQLVDVDVAVDHPLRAIPQLLLERGDALAQAGGFLGMLVVVASEKFAPQSQVVAIALQGEARVRPAVGARCAVVAGARLCRDPAELPNLVPPSLTARAAVAHPMSMCQPELLQVLPRGGVGQGRTRPVGRWALAGGCWTPVQSICTAQ